MPSLPLSVIIADSSSTAQCAKRGPAIKPRTGDAILFWDMKLTGEDDESSMHASCPVIKGEKWTATKWCAARGAACRATSEPSCAQDAHEQVQGLAGGDSQHVRRQAAGGLPKGAAQQRAFHAACLLMRAPRRAVGRARRVHEERGVHDGFARRRRQLHRQLLQTQPQSRRAGRCMQRLRLARAINSCARSGSSLVAVAIPLRPSQSCCAS